MALAPNFTKALKKKLEEDFVPILPALIRPSKVEEENIVKNQSRALSAFVISKLCGLKDKKAADAVIDDFDDGGIDCIHYKHPTLFIMQTKLKESEQFNEEDALKFKNGVLNFLNGEHQNFNSHFQKRKIELEEAINECEQIQIVVAEIGNGISVNAQRIILSLLDPDVTDDPRVTNQILEINYKNILEYLLSDYSQRRVDAELFIENHKEIKEPHETYIGTISIDNLVDVHKDFGDDLFQRNLRTYLGEKQKEGVNQAIKATLSDSPENFFYLNNGVTALYESLIIKKKGNQKRFVVTGLSVINGAQTISSASSISDELIDEQLKKAQVLITLINSNAGSDLGKAVTKARNHQNPVNIADFVALEGIHERLRLECALSGVIYNYKTGLKTPATGLNIIDKAGAASALMLTTKDPRYPVWHKKDFNSLLNVKSSQYNNLFYEELTGVTLINSDILFKAINRLMWGKEASASNYWERMTYRHGKVALAWIFAKKCRNLIDAPLPLDINVLLVALSAPFDEVREFFWQEAEKIVGYEGNPGPLALFRNQSLALPLITRIMINAFKESLDDEILQRTRSAHDYNDPYPVKLFNYLISKAPQIELPK